MLSRCFQGLARPITRRGFPRRLQNQLRLSQRGACPLPRALGCGAPSGHGRLIAYPRTTGPRSLVGHPQPPLAAFGHPPPNLQYPIGPARGPVNVFPSKIPPPVGAILEGKGLKLALTTGASWSRVSRQKKTAAIVCDEGLARWAILTHRRVPTIALFLGPSSFCPRRVPGAGPDCSDKGPDGRRIKAREAVLDSLPRLSFLSHLLILLLRLLLLG